MYNIVNKTLYVSSESEKKTKSNTNRYCIQVLYIHQDVKVSCLNKGIQGILHSLGNVESLSLSFSFLPACQKEAGKL